MITSPNQIIANAIMHCLDRFVAHDQTSRVFVRLEDFSVDVYRHVLETIRSTLKGRPVTVRTVGPIKGFEQFQIESDKSATWYRNNLKAGHMLLLIFNRRASDAQSLKDMYVLNSTALLRDYVDELIEASLQYYQVSRDEQKVLSNFVRVRLHQLGIESSLEHIVSFFIEIDRLLNDHVTIEEAIAQTLPHLRLFRCAELAKHFHTARAHKLLCDVRDAARIGFEIIDKQRREQYLSNLERAELSDEEEPDGLSSAQKKQLLRTFILGELDDPAQLRQALALDWAEVQQIIKPRRKKASLEQVIQELDTNDKSVQELIIQLQNGSEVERSLIEQILANYGGILSDESRKVLRATIRPHEVRSADFLTGLLSALIDLRHLREDNEAAGAQVVVQFQPSKEEQALTEAVQVFRCLYGGIETVMSSIRWELAELWKLAVDQTEEEDLGSDETERVKTGKLAFNVLLQRKNRTIASTTLIWEYRSNSLAAATYQALAYENSLFQSSLHSPLFAAASPSLRIPFYTSCKLPANTVDLDLHRPLYTFGNWHQQADVERNNLRYALEKNFRDLRVPAEAGSALMNALDSLEQAWANVVQAALKGLFDAPIIQFIQAYQQFLAKTLEYLSKKQYKEIYQTINKAWIISESSQTDWAVIPLIHPLKLDWWYKRAIYYHDIITQMFRDSTPARAIDDKRFRREMSLIDSALATPPVIALANDLHQGYWYVAHEDVQGYTLFRGVREADNITGTNVHELATDEQELMESQAVETLVGILQDYIETYPFAREGITVVLLECHNSALPVLMLKRLSKATERNPERIHLIVHTSTYGGSIYRRLDEWLASEPPGTKREGAAYLPRIVVEVRECALNELLQSVKRSDVVVLVDLFNRANQPLKTKLNGLTQWDAGNTIIDFYPARPEPFREGAIERLLQLIPNNKPDVLRLFLLCQYAGNLQPGAEMPAVMNDLELAQVLSLNAWQADLERLHHHFNWVVCYDQVIDRFLLKAACHNRIQIVRYALGLGVQRLHHLTVSSASRTQEIVVKRLANRLANMVPRIERSQCQQIAAHLAEMANRISGDIVLRAAGPGLFLNELIGLVVAMFQAEQAFQRQYTQALSVWILLDDYKHWFRSGKMPDLLLIGLQKVDERALVHLQLVEAKCVNATAFEREAKDACLQVRSGVSRLASIFAPGGRHLDAPFWYDQLYRAIAGNVQFNDEQFEVWEVVSEQIHRGEYDFVISGASYVFCYDDQVGIFNGPDIRPFTETAADAPAASLTEHRYGRNELIAALRQLVQQTSALDPQQIFDWTPDPAERSHDVAAEAVGLTANVPASHSRVLSPISNTPGEQIYLSSPRVTPQVQQFAIAEGQNNSPSVQSNEEPLAPIPPVETAWLEQKARDIERALRQRGVQLYSINANDADHGPSIVRFKFRLKPNQQLKRVQAMAEDLARDLKLSAPPYIDNVPETDFVGIDIPRPRRETIYLRPFLKRLPLPKPAELPIVIGIAPDGQPIIEDFAEFPHLLVAGATKSGKSVFLRNLLLSLLTVYRPGALELLIIDPKQTDFTLFNKLPYLRGGKVIVDRKAVQEALLDLARTEMPRRQKIMANRSMNIKAFNQRYPEEALPPIIALIDEYGLLTSHMSKKEREAFEQSLGELAAAARAVGIHIILATQHPSAEVITPIIKANLDARVALRVASQVNSRVVLDTTGAEHLLGQGDMLFRRPDGRILRLQAPFMDEEELMRLLDMYR
ncbi:DNA translocase FtsK [Chloroflexus sp.]|uniref:DNA translocase FtsK n=1 Tax=Chloroflexus sp. TaxID=1904827 RepID=UPI003C7757FD